MPRRLSALAVLLLGVACGEGSTQAPADGASDLAQGFELLRAIPATISARGGELRLEGRSLPAAPIVRVAGEDVAVLHAQPESIEVRVGPGLAGTVDVEVQDATGGSARLPGGLRLEPVPLVFAEAPPYLLPALSGASADVRAVVELAGEIYLGTADGLRVWHRNAPGLAQRSENDAADAPPLVPGGRGDVRDLAAGDFDGDGQREIFVCTAGEHPNFVVAGTPLTLPARAAPCIAAAAGDLDGDGDDEAVVLRHTVEGAALRVYMDAAGGELSIDTAFEAEPLPERELDFALDDATPRAALRISTGDGTHPLGALTLQLRGDGSGAQLAVVQEAADGRRWRSPLGTADFEGWRGFERDAQSEWIGPPEETFDPEAGIAALEIEVLRPEGAMPLEGAIAVREVVAQRDGEMSRILGAIDLSEALAAWPEGAVDLALTQLDSDAAPEIVVLESSGALSTLRRRGDSWTMTQLAQQAGEGALRLLPVDVDADNDVDLVITRADAPDTLLRNDGYGRFFDDSWAAFPLERAAGAAVVAADLDRDGRPDLVVGGAGGSDRLYRNRGDGRFADESAGLGIAGRHTDALLLFDSEGDGDLDVLSLGATPALRVLQPPNSAVLP